MSKNVFYIYNWLVLSIITTFNVTQILLIETLILDEKIHVCQSQLTPLNTPWIMLCGVQIIDMH